MQHQQQITALFQHCLPLEIQSLTQANNNHLPTFTRCNFAPYGRDIPGGVATGRFCDGRILSDMIGNLLLLSTYICHLSNYLHVVLINLYPGIPFYFSAWKNFNLVLKILNVFF